MSAGAWSRDYASYLDFYRDAYAGALREVRPAGSMGAAMFLSDQQAGDWSDAATPDLVICATVGAHGGATIDVGAGRFRIGSAAPGSFIVVPPGTATTFLVDGPHSINVLTLPYARLLALAGEGGGLPADGDFRPLHAGLQEDAEVSALLARLWLEGASGSPHGALWADGAILQIASCLLRLRHRRRPALRGGLAPWQLRRVTDYMRAHLDRDVSLAELAALAGLSPHHFCRAFADSTGSPPHRWLVERRVERAQEMMAADPRLGLTEVALAVGYGSQSAFGTAFRRVTGTTPSAWRRDWLR